MFRVTKPQIKQKKVIDTQPAGRVIALNHAPPIVQNIQLLSLDNLPDRFRSVFKYELFNAVQSKCFPNVYGTDDNMIISSPTGSGKTVVMELAICRLLQNSVQGTCKIVYQAPTKALCSERKRDWDQKFAHLNIKCVELTGDTQSANLPDIKAGDIIITTPEKWDSMTRKWHDHKKLFELVRLFLVIWITW